MDTIEQSLPIGQAKTLSQVEKDTGLTRTEILAHPDVTYHPMKDSVRRGKHDHKGFRKTA